MQKTFILSLIISLILISCRSENDSQITELDKIVGIWKMAKTITISGVDNSTIIEEYNPDDCKQKSTYEFNQNGKYIMNDYNKISNECKHQNRTVSYTYNPKEQKLIIDNTEAKVLELTDSKLVVYVQDNYDYDGDGTNDYLKYVFKK